MAKAWHVVLRKSATRNSPGDGSFSSQHFESVTNASHHPYVDADENVLLSSGDPR